MGGGGGVIRRYISGPDTLRSYKQENRNGGNFFLWIYVP